MKKVIVIGCPGSGKSTFSRKLHKITQIPLYHLDMMYWNADKTTVDGNTLIERQNEVIKRDEWIIDGNYDSTMELRMNACDTVIFLDYPLELCLSGVEARRGNPRPDMPWIEDETNVDEEFIQFIKNYNQISKPNVINLLEKYKNKEIVIFTDRTQAEEYLSEM
ncbi:adenylate kinase [Helcococcus ovis]|uniref:Adenylate kinase n=1 Tax=Helcococcus ovis TaxID=72026 RepID=A0A4R9C322_9FIRM|nr:adenylate kinase [Helcococcus ovis]TFF65544.1 adenylate kinase [Helcococcus ovis]TFF67648.1 adenylate kinase [Helcococcus ovis]